MNNGGVKMCLDQEHARMVAYLSERYGRRVRYLLIVAIAAGMLAGTGIGLALVDLVHSCK